MKTAIASMAPRPRLFPRLDGMGRRCHRLQLQRRARRHAGRHRAGARARQLCPLSAQPNAGIPRSVEGRNIYLCSPEYMASYARKFVAAGVRIVGGCCGTTPDHIRVMKSALRVGEARAKIAAASTRLQRQTAPGQFRLPWKNVAAGQKACRGRVRHHGGDRSAQGDRRPQRDRRRDVSEVGGRGCDQYSRQPASLRPHEQSGAFIADPAAGRH